MNGHLIQTVCVAAWLLMIAPAVLDLFTGWVNEARPALRAKAKTRGAHTPHYSRMQKMKHIVPIIAATMLLSLASWTPAFAAEENEQTVQMSDLPAAVQTTIKDKAGSNQIVKIEKKTEEGKTVYEQV